MPSSYIEVKPSSKLLESAVMAKPCAWISVDEEHVALVDGYNVANMSPIPTLMMSSDAIPKELLNKLKDKGSKVTLSCASLREQGSLHRAKTPLSFEEMGLTPQSRDGYPPAVESAPIQMYCHLIDKVDLGVDDDDDDKTMILVGIDVIVMKKEVLTPPPPSKNPNDRKVLALVDAIKMKPIASLGNGRYGTMKGVHLLLRPSKTDNGGWISDPLMVKQAEPRDEALADSSRIIPDVIEWKTSEPSPLGFNPIKAIVLPRPIGWISTYYPDETVPHAAPYSFFINVARDMVAFAAYRPANNGEPLKDAQLDVEEGKCFGVNTVTQDLVEAMNLSSAPIDRAESEFELGGGIVAEPATYVKAPLVRDAKCKLECEYVKTVDVGGFSVVIGKIVAMKVAKDVLLTNDDVDATKLKPVTRGGYVDEYAIIDEIVEPILQSSYHSS